MVIEQIIEDFITILLKLMICNLDSYNLLFAFDDLKKAFDRVPRKVLR